MKRERGVVTPNGILPAPDLTATVKLVLQSQLCPPLTSLDVGLLGARLVTATPRRPVEDVCGGGWRLPQQRQEQMAHFGHGERQQLHRRAHDATLFAVFLLCELPFFWVC
jgi:hypothetical protein